MLEFKVNLCTECVDSSFFCKKVFIKIDDKSHTEFYFSLIIYYLIVYLLVTRALVHDTILFSSFCFSNESLHEKK